MNHPPKTLSFLFFYGLGLLFLVVPNFILLTLFFHGLNFFDAQRVSGLIFISYSALLCVLLPTARQAMITFLQKLPPLSRMGLMLFFLLGLLSAAQAAVPSMAFLEVTLYFLLMIFMFLLAAVNLTEQTDRFLRVIVWVSVIDYLVIFWSQFIFVFHVTSLDQNIFANSVFFPGFLNIRFFVQYQIWLIPLLLSPCLGVVEFRWWKPILFILSSFWWALAFYNASRGEVLSLAGAGLVVWLFFRKDAYRWLVVQLSAVVLGLLIYQFCFVHVLSLSYEFNFNSGAGHYMDRIMNWKQALTLVREHPLLGAGPMHYAYYPPPSYFAHPHDSILLIACEWGLPALLILLFLFIYGFSAWMKRFSGAAFKASGFSTATHSWILSLTAACVAGFAYSLVDGVFVMPVGQLTLAMMVGIMLGVYFRYTEVQKPIKTLSLVSFFLCLLIAVGVLWVIVGPQLPNLQLHEYQWLYQHPQTGNAFHPGFWLQGLIFP